MTMRRNLGPIFALPLLLLLAVGFVVPLIYVAGLSFMPPRSFGLAGEPTLANYREAALGGYLTPLLWSVLFACATTALTLLIAWPTAQAINRRPGRVTMILTVLIAVPIFISESVRLFGAALFLMPRGGILAGTMQSAFGLSVGSVLYTKTATLIGLVYIHLPFTLFPMMLGLSLVPRDQLDASEDLGANRWQQVREIELPLAMPGIVVGALLTFVLALGANSEASILGGQSVVVIAKAIEQRFNYAQDWPLGSTLSVIVAIITIGLVLPAMNRLDIGKLMGRGR
jgi:spermidine/putrescine transport system permease protein